MGGVPLPEGYHSVNSYIVVDDAERLIHFLVEVSGAVEQGRALRPDGRIDARRRPGRLQTDLACSRWMPRRSRRLQTDTERPSG